MSSRLLSIVGLVSLPISLALMYFLFMDVYAAEAARAVALAEGAPAPVSVSPFVWPTSLPGGRLYLFGLATFFAVLVGASLLLLAQKAQRAEATATP